MLTANPQQLDKLKNRLAPSAGNAWDRGGPREQELHGYDHGGSPGHRCHYFPGGSGWLFRPPGGRPGPIGKSLWKKRLYRRPADGGMGKETSRFPVVRLLEN